MSRTTFRIAFALSGLLLAAAHSSSAQCPPGTACTEYLGKGGTGSYFRILVPDPWDGDLIIVNHGFELNPLTIAPHHTCQGAPDRACARNADCAGVGNGTCNTISLFGFEQYALPAGKAVAASTYSQTGWSVFRSRYDLRDIETFMARRGPGRAKRVIVTGFSMGGAVTVDATMRLKAGKTIHGAIPMCSCSGGGNPSWDAATDIRLAYDFVCDGVPGGTFDALPDVGDGTLSQTELAARVNTCLGVIAPSPDPAEAAAQAARRQTLRDLTRFQGNDVELVITMGYAVLGMGDMVNDPERLRGRRHGWNEGLDYDALFESSVAGAFDAEVPRFGPGPGRARLRENTFVDFRRGTGRRVNYPLLAYAGREDYVCLPEFQKTYADAAAIGGKSLVQVWGSARGHCQFTPNEVRAVFDTYIAWLDRFGTAAEQTPTAADVAARCLAYPGASPATCNFDLAFRPRALAERLPARADWPEAARNPLP